MHMIIFKELNNLNKTWLVKYIIMLVHLCNLALLQFLTLPVVLGLFFKTLYKGAVW